MKDSIRNKLASLIERLAELDRQLEDPLVVSNMDNYRKITKESAEISPVVALYNEYQGIEKDIVAAEEIATDPEMRTFGEDEIRAGKAKLDSLESDLQKLLLPKDPNDEKNTFLEIRGGTGGDESALFAGDLFRMYTRFAERNRWQVEIISESPGEVGGYKEIIARIVGTGVYSRLKFESGGHRVQRVPETETQIVMVGGEPLLRLRGQARARGGELVAGRRGRCRLCLELVDEGCGITGLRQRRRDDFAVGTRRQLRAQLPQQRRLVHHVPALDHLAVDDAQQRDFVHIDAPAGRRDAEKIAGVRAGDAEQQPHAVAVGNHLLHDIDAIRKRHAQIQRRMRPALIAGVARQMQIAAAHAVVIRREHFLLDLRHLRLALRLLEAQRDGDVAGEFAGAGGGGVVHSDLILDRR